MSKFAKVEGHEDLVRDLNTNAILVTDRTAYEKYKQRKQNIRDQKHIREDVEDLKGRMTNMESMLEKILDHVSKSAT